MKERPILFSAPMVRAILEGRKTQTRRIINPQPSYEWHPEVGVYSPTVIVKGIEEPGADVFGASDEDEGRICPHGKPGDRLWVREVWAAGKCADGLAPAMLSKRFWLKDNGGLWYPANNAEPKHPVTPRGKTRVSIHMPRWASRIMLEITEVRVQRLQEISEEDAIAEGTPEVKVPHDFERQGPMAETVYRRRFVWLWNSINSKRGFGWDKNPWVWAITFKEVL